MLEQMLSTAILFLINNISFLLTILFSIIVYTAIKNFSKQLAIASVILLFFVYTTDAWILKINEPSFTRLSIIFTQILIVFFAMMCSYITKHKTTQRIKNEASKYLAKNVLENLDTENPKSTIGKKEVLTIMFIDIRGFSSLSEKHSAEEVSELLNNYFAEIIPVIKKHNGIINKFIGDALLIIFQGKTPYIHARNAVMAGKAILKRIKIYQSLQEAQGKEKITAGIGVNTGEVFTGYIGTEDRCDYTVIGDTVNIASRIEAVNSLYKTDFLITDRTYAFVKEFTDVIKISDVSLKGKQEKVNVYEVLNVSEMGND